MCSLLDLSCDLSASRQTPAHPRGTAEPELGPGLFLWEEEDVQSSMAIKATIQWVKPHCSLVRWSDNHDFPGL